MKKNKNALLLVGMLILFCVNLGFAQGSAIPIYNESQYSQPNLSKSLSLFVKLEDATIVRSTNGVRKTFYTWNSGAYNDSRFAQGDFRWSKLLPSDQWIMRLDSATWALEVRMNIQGNDSKNIAINYVSFNVPEVKTESKRYGWMTDTSYEAGGYFDRGGYIFRMEIYEQRQNFKYKRITSK
jgi:hypothetical protein